MRIALALAAFSLALAPAASAEPVERCPDGDAGRVVTVSEWVYGSACVRVQLCGFVLAVVYGVEVTVNGATLLAACPDTGPAHFDPGTIYWIDHDVCPLLAVAAPGVPGVVDIGWDGDLVVDGYSVWDCPPYDW